MLTPREFYNVSVTSYPALYASSSFDCSRFRIADHVFNTIGNGMTKEHFSGPVPSADVTARAKAFFNVKQFYYGYTEVNKTIINGYEFVRGEGKEIVVLPEEREDHPEIVLWEEFDTLSSIGTPYPNFKKQYSLVWRGFGKQQFDSLGELWIREAIWFYTECEKFFEGADCKNYHGAFPTNDEKQDKRTVKTYQDTIINRYQYKTNEEISTAYKTPFYGDIHNDDDVYAFINRRWKLELCRIREFITETISMLEQKLTELNTNESTSS